MWFFRFFRVIVSLFGVKCVYMIVKRLVKIFLKKFCSIKIM